MNKKKTMWDCDREATRHGGLGAYLSPSVSVKDRFTVRPHVMLNACLAFSWPDNSPAGLESIRVTISPG